MVIMYLRWDEGLALGVQMDVCFCILTTVYTQLPTEEMLHPLGSDADTFSALQIYCAQARGPA